ncbi:MAG TPA: lysophospholipid acyltransferase family protein [Chloroflexota bacterium]
MIYWLHRFGAVASRILPLWFAYGVATAGAPIVFRLWHSKRENTIRNMRQVLGPDATSEEVRALSLRSFVNYGKYMMDMLRLEGRLRDAENRVTVEGWEHFVEASGKGKGLIFVAGHIGNSDLAAAILARRGFPVNVIAEPLRPPKWDRLVQQARAAVGMKVIPMGQAVVRALRVLREDQILAILIDRPLSDQGVTVNFFGRQTQVPGGAATLALRSGASVLGACIVRAGNAYVAEISPEISAPTTGDPKQDLAALTQGIFSWLEQVIRRYPDQWFMFRAMWPEALLAESPAASVSSTPS